MTAPPLLAEASRTIAARPQEVWDALTDLDTMAAISPENVRSAWLPGESLAVGARFRGHNRLRFLRWSTTATVTDLRQGELFAFEAAGTTWRYRLTEVPGGTRVEESMSRSTSQPAIVRGLQRLAGVTDRRADLQRNIESSLSALDHLLAHRTHRIFRTA